jgi:hypothetical protein
MLNTCLKDFFKDIALGFIKVPFNNNNTTFDNDNFIPSLANKVLLMSSLLSYGNVLALIS